MKKLILSFYAIMLLVSTICFGQDYKNAKLPDEDRVKDLISKMTIDEKIRQIDMYPPSDFFVKGKWSEDKTFEIMVGNSSKNIHQSCILKVNK